MSEPTFVNYELQDGIATITMNDGFKNLISPKMLRELNQALDQAEKDSAVVILTGYADIFSAGFDLKVIKAGGIQGYRMINDGFALTTRMLSFPTPIIIACNGHALAMGAFMILSGDYRIGVNGPFKIAVNEVAIGITMAATPIAVCKQRLTPAHFVRAVMQSEEYNPDSAVEAGFLDRVVDSVDLMPEALKTAARLAKLDQKVYYKSKLRARRQVIRAQKRANRLDRIDVFFRGVKRLLSK